MHAPIPLMAVFSLLALLIAPSLAKAETRVALVIGNGAYDHAPRLANPVNDANDMAAALREIGFEVSTITDASDTDMLDALVRFSSKAEGADIALVFYAGHGVQVDGINYLLPVDARLESKAVLKFRTPKLDQFLEAMAGAKVRLAFFDACRDNPLATRNRSLGTHRGLAPVKAIGARGTLIAYATAPGDVADDGHGRNSPFTAALLRHLPTPNMDVRLMMGEVRADVERATDTRQTPWVSESISGKLTLVAKLFPPEPEIERPEPQSEPNAIAVEWSVIQGMPRGQAQKHAVADFLSTFPGSAYERPAQVLLKSYDADADEQSDTAPTMAVPDTAPALTPEEEEKALELTRANKLLIQESLNALGFSSGTADGVFGRKTRSAIREWQASTNTPETGFITYLQLSNLLVQAEKPLQETRAAEMANISPEARKEKLRCDEGKADGCNQLGAMYGLGEDAPQNSKRAAALYQKACFLGGAAGCFNLGVLHRKGNGVPKDNKKALHLYQTACHLGLALGCYNTGIFFENGIGQPKDNSQAAVFYRQACEMNEFRGCHNLGILYNDGNGVSRDYSQSLDYYLQACVGGIFDACTNAGVLYSKGRGVRRDIKRAADLYRKGCDGGNALGCTNLKRLLNR